MSGFERDTGCVRVVDISDNDIDVLRQSMAKKITVYVLLITLVLATVVANVFAINALIADNVLRDNKAELSSINRVRDSEPSRSCHVGFWVRLPEDVKYYSALYGLIDVGNIAVFETEAAGETVTIEVYEVWGGRFVPDEGGKEVKTEDFDDMWFMHGMTVYEDRTVVFFTEQPSDRFMVINSADPAVVDAAVYDLLESYSDEKYGIADR